MIFNNNIFPKYYDLENFIYCVWLANDIGEREEYVNWFKETFNTTNIEFDAVITSFEISDPETLTAFLITYGSELGEPRERLT